MNKDIMNDLFQYRKTIGENLLHFIRMKGYSRISFSKMTEISRSSLDRILKGKSTNATIFLQQMTKITETLDLPIDYFKNGIMMQPEISPMVKNHSSDLVTVNKRGSTPQVQELLQDLDNIMELAAIYFKRL